jgi:hypothetical protein
MKVTKQWLQHLSFNIKNIPAPFAKVNYIKQWHKNEPVPNMAKKGKVIKCDRTLKQL